MKKTEYSAYWRISKTGEELVISPALLGVFLQRKVQAFEKEDRGEQEGERKMEEQEWAKKMRVGILMELSALCEVQLQNTRTTDSTWLDLQLKGHMHLQPKGFF